jgi:hypothetical protein
MSSLAIDGEPDGWLEIGYTASALAARLDDALSGADTLGAQPLARAWYGPASGAFTGDWSSRRARYEELIDLARRAARVITEYGEALREVQEHARALEYTWCATGLVVSPLGVFDLPAGVALLPAPARLSLEHALAGALRDLESLAADVLACASDLVIGLGPVVALLEEFALAVFGSGAITLIEKNFMEGIEAPLFVPGSVLGTIPDVLRDVVEYLPEAAAGAATGLASFGDRVLPAVPWVDALWDVGDDAWLRHEGLLASLEQNSGGIAGLVAASLLAGVGETVGGVVVGAVVGVVAVGAPEAVVAVGAVVVGAALVGIVAAGVGAVVQTGVNHNKKTINRDVDDIGQDITRDFDNDVVPVIENHIAPGIENAVGTGPA